MPRRSASRTRARATPDVATTGAVYLQLENDTDTDEALVGGVVPEEVAAGLMLHRTTSRRKTARLGRPDGRERDGGDVAPRAAGRWLCHARARRRPPDADGPEETPLETGETFELELVLASGDRVTTEVEVRDP